MDHLPYDLNPLSIKVPYLCTETYNYDGDWLDYPAKHQISLGDLRDNQYWKYLPQKIGPFLQNWLFFGLLNAVLPFKLKPEEFVSEDDKGMKVITTTLLPEYLDRWKEYAMNLSAEKKHEMWQKNFSILEDALKIISYFSNWPETAPTFGIPFNPVPREVGLSFAILGSGLDLANREILNPQAGRINLSWSSGSLFLEHMECQGWCPFLISRMDGVLTLEAKYYAATMGPPRVKRNHRSCSDDRCLYRATTIQHVGSGCSCEMLSPDMRKMQEIVNGEGFPLLRYDIRGEDAGKGNLEVISSRSEIKYVAMSHVWSDGLGNFDGNSMPRCQLTRIQEAVNNLYQQSDAAGDRVIDVSVPFWMDTLLIPNDEQFRNIKDEAIRGMTQIYKSADKVLVVDSEVATCNVSSHPLTIIFRVLLSNWLRRLWTLQEGVFARSINFLLSDGVTSLASLLRDVPSDNLGVGIKANVQSHFANHFGRSLGQESQSLPDEEKHNEASWKRIEQTILNFGERVLEITGLRNPSNLVGDVDNTKYRDIWIEVQVTKFLQAVVTRTSTFISDEALCLALLLEMDPKPIIQAMDSAKEAEREFNRAKAERESAEKDETKNKTSMALVAAEHKAEEVAEWAIEEPMITLLKLLNSHIPPYIPLLPGPRNKRLGFRWAPKSFLKDVTHDYGHVALPLQIFEEYPSSKPRERPSGVLCQRGGGLTVMFPGLLLGQVRGQVTLKNYFVIDTSDGSGAKEVIAERKPPLIWTVLHPGDPGEVVWEDVAPHWENSNQMAIVICSYGPEWRTVAEDALLVRLKGKEEEDCDGSIHVERICRIIVKGTPLYDNKYWMKDSESRVCGSWLPVTQKWCID